MQCHAMEATKKKKKNLKLYNVRCSGGKADGCDADAVYIYHVHVVVDVNGRTDIHRTKEQAYVVYSLRVRPELLARWLDMLGTNGVCLRTYVGAELMGRPGASKQANC
jgi:hypothetical protein